jgi:hypothetical protein
LRIEEEDSEVGAGKRKIANWRRYNLRKKKKKGMRRT